ncbi:unnamed protein product [Caenorhabditis auriculariae]|uniref:Uncharacterized protein n=1 Tax=Caenorhabditis auriculariae TaxID=2777116 RepID=A0A8S1HWW9_9PELO|nr:unnamed protein product [Caenorhabditis auriculariae]
MGAASFDATLVVVNNSNLDVVVAHGHFDLGGDVIDRHLMDYARKIVRESIEIDPFSDFHFKEQLRMTCQHAKHVLSIADQAKIPFQCKGKSLEIPFPDFSSQDSPSYGKIREAIDRSIAITEKILETAFRIGIQQNQIRILLLGGTSRIPMIRKKLEVFSVAINCQLSPDTAVAEGAARFGQGLAVERVYCLNNRPH